MWCMHLTLSPGVNYGRTQEYWTWRSNMHKLFRNGFEGLNTSIDPHTFMYFKAPVHGSSIPGYISREGYIARLTYPQRLCSLYGGLWASRVTLRSLLVCIPSEEGWFPLLSLLKTDNLWVDAFLFWNLPEWFWLQTLCLDQDEQLMGWSTVQFIFIFNRLWINLYQS